MNITTTKVALVLRVHHAVFEILKLMLNCLFTVNSGNVILPAIMSRDRWKKGSYISKPRQMCFGYVASIKELYKLILI
jgi:hypothetical protein